MCGIVGYIGEEQAAPILLNGLQKLEYRGYDSAGVAVYNDTGVHVVKSKGRLSVLDGILQGGKELPGTVGIGHTRWATHGAPSDVNSHPQGSLSIECRVICAQSAYRAGYIQFHLKMGKRPAAPFPGYPPGGGIIPPRRRNRPR